MFADRARNRLSECLEVIDGPDGADGLSELALRLDTAVRRIDEPMRLAVVGQIKKGKSTLVNALLGEHVVATGSLELTFNINELVWGPDRGLMVHFKDGRGAEYRLLDELERLTARDEANREFLSAIEKIEVSYPNDLLREFVLVDTPGLNSVFDTDSQNTLAYLGRTADEVERDSTAALSHADAIVYVFTKGFAASDRDVVAEFGSAVDEMATPLRAVAALNRCEFYWHPVDRPDPLAIAERVVRRYLDEGSVQRLFFAIRPVCALLAAGAQTLGPDDLEALVDLAAVDPEILTKRVRDAQRFSTKEFDDIPVPADRRDQLVRRLTNYGVHLACTLLRDGADPEADLGPELLARSGVPELRELCVAHFGNRATLIKLDGALDSVIRAVRAARRDGDGDRAAIDKIGGVVEQFQATERDFEELAALTAFYAGELSLSPEEVSDLLAVTGEHGTTCAARTGLREDTPVDAIVAEAKQRAARWSRRVNDPLIDRRTEEAARVVQRSLERIVHHAREAQRHLNLEI